jgi:hypothetical protein
MFSLYAYYRLKTNAVNIIGDGSHTKRRTCTGDMERKGNLKLECG